ncbi:uncharacterized protein STEHIDRAFT_116458 [Stereum hirsutum FP-91666 SS1]|uniref:Uncharacterized protein n=1 Tax=Stereum hirsutum (strain FP-91666) TaxID=721885 RepID=R7RW72_STEHR|nr:uncharacterized protein STEHIDRAFT_116458 [Stereum hirsutum FP-91666 SS1]EIM79556.1 hypothetical protein STEHIDRAFT_116458 [Stereum hirsutum FP-91666 SS1]
MINPPPVAVHTKEIIAGSSENTSSLQSGDEARQESRITKLPSMTREKKTYTAKRELCGCGRGRGEHTIVIVVEGVKGEKKMPTDDPGAGPEHSRHTCLATISLLRVHRPSSVSLWVTNSELDHWTVSANEFLTVLKPNGALRWGRSPVLSRLEGLQIRSIYEEQITIPLTEAVYTKHVEVVHSVPEERRTHEIPELCADTNRTLHREAAVKELWLVVRVNEEEKRLKKMAPSADPGSEWGRFRTPPQCEFLYRHNHVATLSPHRIVSQDLVPPSFAPPLLLQCNHTTCIPKVKQHAQYIHETLYITVHGAKARSHLQESRRSIGLSRIAPSTPSPLSPRWTSALISAAEFGIDPLVASNTPSPVLSSYLNAQNDYGASAITLPGPVMIDVALIVAMAMLEMPRISVGSTFTKALLNTITEGTTSSGLKLPACYRK